VEKLRLRRSETGASDPIPWSVGPASGLGLTANPRRCACSQGRRTQMVGGAEPDVCTVHFMREKRGLTRKRHVAASDLG
jgi:hypothetical protein